MAHAKEFKNEERMKEYIVQLWHDNLAIPGTLFTVDDIVIDKSNLVNDSKIGWEDIMLVCVKRIGEEDYIKKYGVPQCIGLCTTKYPK
ncbi:MAG: hypothetical protein HFJ55_00140 [Clostridia bacterium]|nr:hypothetical protein [Clostridia bacterium]